MSAQFVGAAAGSVAAPIVPEVERAFAALARLVGDDLAAIRSRRADVERLHGELAALAPVGDVAIDAALFGARGLALQLAEDLAAAERVWFARYDARLVAEVAGAVVDRCPVGSAGMAPPVERARADNLTHLREWVAAREARLSPGVPAGEALRLARQELAEGDRAVAASVPPPATPQAAVPSPCPTMPPDPSAPPAAREAAARAALAFARRHAGDRAAARRDRLGALDLSGLPADLRGQVVDAARRAARDWAAERDLGPVLRIERTSRCGPSGERGWVFVASRGDTAAIIAGHVGPVGAEWRRPGKVVAAALLDEGRRRSRRRR